MKQLGYLASLVRFAARENRLLFLSLIMALASAAIEIAAMAVLMPMATAIGGQPPAESRVNGLFLRLGLEPNSHNLLMLFLGLLGLRIVTQFASQALIIYLGRRLLLQLTTRAFSSVMWHVPVSTIEKRSIGYFITLAGDEASRGSTVIVSLTQFTTTIALGGLYFLAIFSYSPLTAALVVTFLIFTFLTLFESFRYSHRLGARQIEQSQSASSVLLDAINGVRSVRSFGAEKFVTDSYFSQIRGYVRTLALIDLIAIGAKLAPAFLLVVIAAAVASFGVTTSGGSLTLPTFATLAVLLMRFFPVIGQALGLMLRVVSDIQAGQDITRAIKEFGSSAPTPIALAGNAPLKDVALAGVGFEHIVGVPVLSNLSIVFRAGRSYAIVGSSGSGKSTLLDLILGIHEPTRGTISINGVALQNRKPSDTRGRMVLVSQETAIFNETVLGNILLGYDAPPEAVVRACRIAHAHDFITDLPNSYNTLLSYRGSNLSGGQKQRLGIARAVLRQPDVVLLDESTSALDAETRDKVVDGLLKEFADRIIIFVTHDEAIMHRVDEVIRLEPIGISAQRSVSETVSP